MKKIPLLAVMLICRVATADDIPEVRTVPPVKASQAARYEVPGRTEPVESATIFTRATGIISERKFEIGDEVKAGELVAVIDAPEIDRAVDAARAGLDQAKATAENALSLFNRSKRLLKSNVVSAEETEQRETTASEAEAAVKVAQAQLARLEEQQRFSTVRAPFDGVISARNFDRGDLAKGDAASTDGWLYRLDRLDTLRFVISATPDLALRLSKEAEVKVRFGEFPGREFVGKVAHASRVFDAGSGTMRVELLLQNKELVLPAGLTGTAAFQLTPPEGTFIVPVNALLSRQGTACLALAEDGKVRFLEVLPGRNFGREVEVTSSRLSETARVILNPNAMLKEGDPVRFSPLTAAK